MTYSGRTAPESAGIRSETSFQFFSRRCKALSEKLLLTMPHQPGKLRLRSIRYSYCENPARVNTWMFDPSCSLHEIALRCAIIRLAKVVELAAVGLLYVNEYLVF